MNMSSGLAVNKNVNLRIKLIFVGAFHSKIENPHPIKLLFQDF